MRDGARTTPRPTTCRLRAVVVGAAAAAAVEMSACCPCRMELPSWKYSVHAAMAVSTQSLSYMCVCVRVHTSLPGPQGDPTRDHTCRPTAAGPRLGGIWSEVSARRRPSRGLERSGCGTYGRPVQVCACVCVCACGHKVQIIDRKAYPAHPHLTTPRLVQALRSCCLALRDSSWDSWGLWSHIDAALTPPNSLVARRANQHLGDRWLVKATVSGRK